MKIMATINPHSHTRPVKMNEKKIIEAKKPHFNWNFAPSFCLLSQHESIFIWNGPATTKRPIYFYYGNANNFWWHFSQLWHPINISMRLKSVTIWRKMGWIVIIWPIETLRMQFYGCMYSAFNEEENNEFSPSCH